MIFPRKLIGFERNLVFNKRNVMILLFTIFGTYLLLFFSIVHWMWEGNLQAEITALTKITFLLIVFIFSYQRFVFFESGMVQHAICAIRSKTQVFFFQVANHFLQITTFSLIIFPAFPLFYQLRARSEMMVSQTMDFTDFFIRVIWMVMMSTACSVIFIASFRRASRFLLGIYFIPQIIMVLTYVPRKFSDGLYFVALNPVNMAVDALTFDIGPVKIILTILYIPLLIYISFLIFKKRNL